MSRTRYGSIQFMVYTAIEKAKRPISIDILCMRLPDLSRQQVRDAANHLADRGPVERVMRGVYRLPPDANPLTAPLPPAGHEQSQPEPAALVKRSETVRADVETVLELLFPEGIPTRHLISAMTWVEATIQMVTRIREDD